MSRRMWQRGPNGEIVRAACDPAESPLPPATGGAPRLPGRARLLLALRLGTRDTYDYLGALIFASVLWALAAALGSLGGQALGVFGTLGLPPRLAAPLTWLVALLGAVLLGSPTLAGVFRYARNAAARQEPEIYDLAWGFRHALRRALPLGTIQAAGSFLLAGNCYFYFLQRLPVLVIIGAVFGYLLVFWWLTCLYQWPLLVEQDLTPASAIKKSALLVLDNFPYTLGLGTAAVLLTILGWATGIGGPLLWAGTLAMFLTQGTRELLRKYGALGPDPTLDPVAGETHELGDQGRHE